MPRRSHAREYPASRAARPPGRTGHGAGRRDDLPAAGQASADALVAEPRVDDRRGCGRDHGRRGRLVDRPDRVRARQRDRGLRQRHHRVALHRPSDVLCECGAGARRSWSPSSSSCSPRTSRSSCCARCSAASAPRRPGSACDQGRGARQNMLCAYLAGALLLGLLGSVVAGAWWLDRSVGMLIAIVAVKEGP
jgi:hypothetical protein